MKELRATAVRVGVRVLLIPAGQPVPDGAVVYGPAARELVYRTFYGSTHCRQGHPRVGPSGCAFHFSGECYRDLRSQPPKARDAVVWTWGVPA